MSDERKIVRVSADSDKAIRAFASKKGIEYGEAADALIYTGVCRLNALARYAKQKKQGTTPPGKKKAAAKKTAAKSKPKAKAAPAKKPAKAKPPTANGIAQHAPEAAAAQA